jgi:hypothetical protein
LSVEKGSKRTRGIVAVEVNTSGNAVKLGAPHTLFQAVGIQGDFAPYDVSVDGKKFLINSGNLKEDTEPLTPVQNCRRS